jgi:hypothetical protein
MEKDSAAFELYIYRGLNGTNPSAFRVDEDGVSVFETPLEGYKYNLKFIATFTGEKKKGVVAQLTDPILNGAMAEFTPQFGEGHWSLRFPGLSSSEVRSLLSAYAKTVLK